MYMSYRLLNFFQNIVAFIVLILLSFSAYSFSLEIVEIDFTRSTAPNVLNEWDGAGMFINSINYGRMFDLNSPLSSISETQVESNTILASRPYFYPNPFRLSDGSILGFRLFEPAIFEIRIYDMRAHELFKESFDSSLIGGHENIQIRFDSSSFHYAKLSSGIYFFLIIHEGKVIGRGKFALRPE